MNSNSTQPCWGSMYLALPPLGHAGSKGRVNQAGAPQTGTGPSWGLGAGSGRRAQLETSSACRDRLGWARPSAPHLKAPCRGSQGRPNQGDSSREQGLPPASQAPEQSRNLARQGLSSPGPRCWQAVSPLSLGRPRAPMPESASLPKGPGVSRTRPALESQRERGAAHVGRAPTHAGRVTGRELRKSTPLPLPGRLRDGDTRTSRRWHRGAAATL